MNEKYSFLNITVNKNSEKEITEQIEELKNIKTYADACILKLQARLK